MKQITRHYGNVRMRMRFAAVYQRDINIARGLSARMRNGHRAAERGTVHRLSEIEESWL